MEAEGEKPAELPSMLSELDRYKVKAARATLAKCQVQIGVIQEEAKKAQAILNAVAVSYSLKDGDEADDETGAIVRK